MRGAFVNSAPASRADSPEMNRPRLRILAFGFLLLAAAGVAAQPFTEGGLWRISRAGIPDSFVFGTIHIADDRVSRAW